MRRISEFPNYSITEYGEVYSHNRRKFLSKQLNNRGYYRVNLSKEGKPFCRFIHVMVAKTFIGDFSDLLTVDHIDEVKTNNHVTNLRWITNYENFFRSYVKSGRIDETLFSFEHPEHGNFISNRYDLYQKFNLPEANVRRLTSDGVKCKGWSIKCCWLKD